MNWLLSKVLIACLKQCIEQMFQAMAYSVLSNDRANVSSNGLFCLKQCIEQMFPATVYFGLSPVCFLRGVRASVAEYSPDCREFALS